MKKIIIILTMMISAILVGCAQVQETYDNGVPTYFTEPDGYIIAEIKCDTSGLFLKNYYGYISENDYDDFVSGELNGALIVLHPYENGKSVTVNSNSILSINTGIYKDIRNQ